jgi:hypothetical protein
VDRQQRIDFAIERALEDFDAGNHEIAVVSFISELSKDEDTATCSCVETGVLFLNAIPGGREVFEETLRHVTIDVQPTASCVQDLLACGDGWPRSNGGVP